MFYDINDFPHLVNIRENITVISNELNKAIESNNLVKFFMSPTDNTIEHYTNFWVRDNGFHPEQIGYDIRKGEYTTLGIYKDGFPIKHFNAQALFGETLALIRPIDNLHYSGFFKLYSNAELTPHSHTRKNLIFHLLLHDLTNGASIIKCGEEARELKRKGDYAIFDYSYEHSSINLSQTDRINFILDFKP